MCYYLLAIYYLPSIIWRDRVVRTATTARPVPLRPHVPRGHVRPGVPKKLTPPPLTSEFVGMASYAPTYFYELLDDKVESDGSSIGDVAPSQLLSWECAMADTLGQPPVIAESAQTHTPPDPHAGALAWAQGHAEELRQRR